MGPEHKNLMQQTDQLNRLREEIRGLDGDIMRDEAAIGDFKRAATRAWMGLKFGGLLECCEKGVVRSIFIFHVSLFIDCYERLSESMGSLLFP